MNKEAGKVLISIASLTNKNPDKMYQKLKPRQKENFMRAINFSKSIKFMSAKNTDVETKMRDWQ